MTLEQFKARAYDIMRQMESLQVELRVIHQEVQKLELKLENVSETSQQYGTKK